MFIPFVAVHFNKTSLWISIYICLLSSTHRKGRDEVREFGRAWEIERERKRLRRITIVLIAIMSLLLSSRETSPQITPSEGNYLSNRETIR